MTNLPPRINEFPLVQSASRALQQFKALANLHCSLPSAGELLYERARLLQFEPRNGCSFNGTCHLLDCVDGMIAVNLPRESDWELMDPWLGPWYDSPQVSPGDWGKLKQICRQLQHKPLLTQAQDLGLAATTVENVPPAPSSPVNNLFTGPRQSVETSPQHIPLVVDLSSLWAGPLCGHLLLHAGCRVIKVEASNRLDGARGGSHLFYQLLNQGKESLTLDFGNEHHIQLLKQLLSQADMIIEASRPRALRNLGIDAEELLQVNPGKIWLSITGYGRTNGNEDRIGFGDDAGAAAGLCQVMYDAIGEYQFVGDAIADPLTGIHSALYLWQAYGAGASQLLEANLRDITSYSLQQELNDDRTKTMDSLRLWQKWGGELDRVFTKPPRPVTRHCASPGEHSSAIVDELRSGKRP